MMYRSRELNFYALWRRSGETEAKNNFRVINAEARIQRLINQRERLRPGFLADAVYEQARARFERARRNYVRSQNGLHSFFTVNLNNKAMDIKVIQNKFPGYGCRE